MNLPTALSTLETKESILTKTDNTAVEAFAMNAHISQDSIWAYFFPRNEASQS